MLPDRAGEGYDRRFRNDADPAPRHSPLRHVARGPAAVPRRDQDLLRRPPVHRALQLPRLRPRPRLPHVGFPQPEWQHVLPRRGPQVGPNYSPARPGPARLHGPLPYAALRGQQTHLHVQIRAGLFPRQRAPPPHAMQASADDIACRGVRE